MRPEPANGAASVWPAIQTSCVIRAISNLLVFFLQVAAVLPSALVGAWYFGLAREEREAYGHSLSAPVFRVFHRT